MAVSDAVRQIGATQSAIPIAGDQFPSCYGPEVVADRGGGWIAAVGAKTAYTQSGSPWENVHIESFNARFRDEFLDGGICYTLREARIVIEQWRRHDNSTVPRNVLGWRSAAPGTIVRMDHGLVIH
jgi:transposase InsO family protein